MPAEVATLENEDFLKVTTVTFRFSFSRAVGCMRKKRCHCFSFAPATDISRRATETSGKSSCDRWLETIKPRFWGYLQSWGSTLGQK